MKYQTWKLLMAEETEMFTDLIGLIHVIYIETCPTKCIHLKNKPEHWRKNTTFLPFSGNQLNQHCRRIQWNSSHQRQRRVERWVIKRNSIKSIRTRVNMYRISWLDSSATLRGWKSQEKWSTSSVGSPRPSSAGLNWQAQKFIAPNPRVRCMSSDF